MTLTSTPISAQVSTRARRVHHAHLTAPSQDLIGRGHRLLEDALHTVSLPAAERSELLFIRHLNVGNIRSGHSPASLSRQLEQQLQSLSAIALPGTHPNAATAPAVIFPDDLAAYAHFAHRLATGQPLTAWFWPRLFSDPFSSSHTSWHPTHSRHDTLLALLTQLATHPLAPLATATVLQQLHEQKSLTSLLQILQPEDGQTLLTQQGWSTLTQPQIEESITEGDNSLAHSRQGHGREPSQTLPCLFSAVKSCQWPPDDSRLLWAVAIGLIAENPTALFQSNVAVAAQILIQRNTTATNSRAASIESAPHRNYSSSKERPVQSQPGHAPDLTTHRSLSKAPIEQEKESHRDPLTASQLASAAVEQNSRESPVLAFTADHSDIYTDYAGVIYLLNSLKYLNLSAYLSKYNNPTFPHTLLHYIATRLQIPSEDPIFEAITLPYSPSRVPSLSLHIAWYCALRAYTYRQTHLSLRTLICRPARLSLTPTHLDLTFTLEQIDIRIRRAGLDLNPGWLPWFGKVVQFHYEKRSGESI